MWMTSIGNANAKDAVSKSTGGVHTVSSKTLFVPMEDVAAALAAGWTVIHPQPANR